VSLVREELFLIVPAEGESNPKLPIGRSPSPIWWDAARSTGKKTVRKKAAPRKAKPARPLRKEMGSKSKSNKLVCRYYGSDAWLRVSSSGATADAASVSVNAMGRQHERGRRRSKK
jgi:hypothetical protein